MRNIDIKPLGDRKWKRWIRDCQKATEACLESVRQGNKPSFKKLYKRKSIKEAYFFSKKEPFYGKCAYCESYISDFQHGDVEHFRPKGGVTDENDVTVFLKDNNGDPILDEDNREIPHPGYYWLAYDWKNLLPSCIVCNEPKTINDRKIGKHNRFPVIRNHAQTPEDVEAEQPLLINPASNLEDDDPQLHLTIDTQTGIIGHLTERGKMCINVFGLNLRDQLVKDRKRAIDEVRALFSKILFNSPDSEDAKEELIAIRKGRRSYTMAAQAVFDEIQSNIEPILEHRT